MTRNLKALGLALLAVFALGAIGAQGASATIDKFHSDGTKTIITGTNVGTHEFAVGAAGIVKCNKATFQATQHGTETGPQTFSTDTVTFKPNYEECSFGGQPATVNFHHCAYVFYGTTTHEEGPPTSNPTGGEHANVEIECSGPEGKITVHTVNCTVTVPPQLIKHAVRYENELFVPSATRTIATAHNIVVEKSRTTASQPVNGCLTFPTGAVGKYIGTTTNKCFKDERVNPLEGTEQTTPPATGEGETTDCTVSGAPTN